MSLQLIYHLPVQTKNKKNPGPIEVIPIKSPKQIVDVPRLPPSHIKKFKPKYLSDTAQHTPKNMISPVIGPPINKQASRVKKEPPLKQTEKNGTKLTTLLPPLLGANISTQNNVIREKVGPFTLISTAPSSIAFFVITQGRRVLRVLQENISNYTWYYQDISLFKRSAEVKVVFSPSGKIERANLTTSSGSPKVDWVFLKSVTGGIVEIPPPERKKITLIFTLGKNTLKISLANE